LNDASLELQSLRRPNHITPARHPDRQSKVVSNGIGVGWLPQILGH
jgi:hypothetical protein